jgi:hypothetical protein
MWANVSKAEVAKQMELSPATYRNYEQANYIPPKYLPTLCAYYGIDVSDIDRTRKPRHTYDGRMTKMLPFDLAAFRNEFGFTKSIIMQEVGVSRHIYDNVERTNATPPEFYDDFVSFFQRHGQQRPTVESLQAQIDTLVARCAALEQRIEQLERKQHI